MLALAPQVAVVMLCRKSFQLECRHILLDTVPLFNYSETSMTHTFFTNDQFEVAKSWAKDVIRNFDNVPGVKQAVDSALVLLGLAETNVVLLDTIGNLDAQRHDEVTRLQAEVDRKEEIIRMIQTDKRELRENLQIAHRSGSAAQGRYIDAEAARRALAKQVSEQGHKITDLTAEVAKLKKQLGPAPTRYVLEFNERRARRGWELYEQFETAKAALAKYEERSGLLGNINDYQVRAINGHNSVTIAYFTK